MSSEKFENLEDDLSTAIGVLRSVIQKISDLNGEQKKNAVRQAERKLEEANFTVQEMDSEAKAAPPQYRNSMLGKLRALKRDLEQLSRDLKRRKDQGFQSDNLGLDRDERMEASQRARLFQGMDSLNHTSESLTRTHQIAAETDEVGVEILGELGRQREVLTRTNDRVQKSRVECVLFLASPMWMSMPIYSQVQGPTYLSGLLLQKMSSTSQKHKNFVSEPMGDKSVMELAGIGEVLGGKLQEVGFDKASVVLGQYLVFRKDEELFKEWLKDTCGANKKQQTDCHNCLKEWCDQFL